MVSYIHVSTMTSHAHSKENGAQSVIPYKSSSSSNNCFYWKLQGWWFVGGHMTKEKKRLFWCSLTNHDQTKWMFWSRRDKILLFNTVFFFFKVVKIYENVWFWVFLGSLNINHKMSSTRPHRTWRNTYIHLLGTAKHGTS